MIDTECIQILNAADDSTIVFLRKSEETRNGLSWPIQKVSTSGGGKGQVHCDRCLFYDGWPFASLQKQRPKRTEEDHVCTSCMYIHSTRANK